MTSPTSVRIGIALAVALALAASSTATAQTATEVRTAVQASSRQLSVSDLAGAPLTHLSLEPGRAAPFAVRVTDTGMAPSDFQVDVVMNHLYREGAEGPDAAHAIPSSEVSLGHAAIPLDAVGALLDLSPTHLVSSAIGAIDCAAVTASLGLTPAEVVTDPVCTLVDGLLGGAAVTVEDVPLTGTSLRDVDLSALDPSLLPISLSAADLGAGRFTHPACHTGIGAADASCDVGPGTTSHTVIRGRPLTGALTGALATVVDDAVGTAAPEAVTAVVQALQAASSAEVQRLGNRLAGYSAADQATLVEDLLEVTTGTLGVDDLDAVTGTWVSFPTLQVDPTSAAEGSYAGTMTLTLIEP